MKEYFAKNKLKPHYLLPTILVAGFLFTAAVNSNSSNNPPLLDNTDNFVVFSQEEVRIEEETQVSSGDVGSNRDLDIEKDALVNGNLFADTITIDKDTQINGNASFNKLKIQKVSQIFGQQTTPISIPIADIPQIADFTPGEQDFIFQGQDNTLEQGNHRNITLKENSRLVLTGGFYVISKFILENNSTIIFQQTTKLDIKNKFMGGANLSILPDSNLTPDDFVINFAGHKFIHFGKQSFLNFSLLAPNAQVRLGKQTTFRGQIIAQHITIAKDSVLSREEAFIKESDPEKVVIDTDGSVFPVNEILVNFSDSATFSDAQEIADFVDGRIVGFVELMNAYQIEVVAGTINDLQIKIQAIEDLNNSLIEGVFENFVLELE